MNERFFKNEEETPRISNQKTFKKNFKFINNYNTKIYLFNLSITKSSIALLIIFLINIPLVSSSNIFGIFSQKKLNFFTSEIKMIIKGKGIQRVFSTDLTMLNNEFCGFFYPPTEIYVNDILQPTNNNYIGGLIHEENNITLKWSSTIKFTNCMFHGLSNIIQMDLSNFNTTGTTEMIGMFCGCSSLISLDLSNFDTSSVTYMVSMFEGCNSLIFINLKSFIETSNLNLYGIFTGTHSSLITCINEANAPKIKNELTKKGLLSTSDCSNECFNNNMKIIIEERKCITDCRSDIKYKNEFNNICYESCPDKTYIYDDYLCFDINYEKFYKYYNYEQTDCEDIIPKGYYLNDTLYKTIDKCHNDCETCDKKEDEISTNCLTCSNSKYLDLGKCISDCPFGFFSDNFGNNICFCSNNTKCKFCTIDSLQLDLSISCNNGYYSQAINESNENDF